MKNLKLLFIGLMLFAACNEDEDPPSAPESALTNTGILGNWEIQNRTLGDISDLTAKCCEFILFEEDQNMDDLIGKATSTSPGSVNEWVFTLNPADSSMTLVRDNRTLSYSYAIDNDRLSLEYLDDSVTVKEVWIKR